MNTPELPPQTEGGKTHLSGYIEQCIAYRKNKGELLSLSEALLCLGKRDLIREIVAKCMSGETSDVELQSEYRLPGMES